MNDSQTCKELSMKQAIPQSFFGSHKQGTARPVHLTPRELDVLALLCEGLPNKLISRRLNISAATVKCHISRILDELGVSSRLQAVVVAARAGLVGVGATERPMPANAERRDLQREAPGNYPMTSPAFSGSPA
jgi:DNA-binding CsgD family transcriptional regulator